MLLYRRQRPRPTVERYSLTKLTDTWRRPKEKCMTLEEVATREDEERDKSHAGSCCHGVHHGV